MTSHRIAFVILQLIGAGILCDDVVSADLRGETPKQLFSVPEMHLGQPSPGERVRMTDPEYAGTQVHHSLYLPKNWVKGRQYPVIVEYTGNFYAAAGSTGEVKDAHLGYGLSGGDFIWVVLPFVGVDHRSNAITWWGDESATIAYCKKIVAQVCNEFGGDPNRVFLCGFSRGAIAVNYIGLHDDEIAGLWAGFITHDHYDGEREWKNTSWGTPLEAYRKNAIQRLARLHDRPVLVMQENSTDNIKNYIGENVRQAEFTFLDVPMRTIFPVIPNEHVIHPHNDKWLLFGSDTSTEARRWLKKHAMK